MIFKQMFFVLPIKRLQFMC